MTTITTATTTTTNLEPPITSLTHTSSNDAVPTSSDYDDDYNDYSHSSTPYVSAPSSPGRSNFLPSGFFFSAPTSPMHYVLSSSSCAGPSLPPATSSAASFEFEFSSRIASPAAPDTGASMSSADELFLNGQIRPMKLCAHLSRPQHLPPFPEHDHLHDDVENDDVFTRSRDLRTRSRSLRRRTRSMSPLRSTVPFDWLSAADDVVSPSTPKKSEETKEAEATASASSSRCSSAGRSSKRWVFLKDFLRSKSEGGRNYNGKFWQNISFSPAKEKEKEKRKGGTAEKKKAAVAGTAAGGGGKRRSSAHERHYAANRAQAEEMRKKTYLPYRQGLLGCLGFNSKSYGAFHGFARALNPVSSS